MAKDVLFEIGLEELPARFIDDAEKQLFEKTVDWLKGLRIGYQSATSYSTPRRLSILIRQMDEYQETIEEEAKGPALKIAKDESGEWTKAALGFTRGQGKTPEDIYTKEINGISYIHVKKHIEGKPVFDLMPEFRSIIESIQFGKNMRWSTQSMRYARPIRWIVALYGNKVIPIEIAGVESGNHTQGHRFLGKGITISEPAEYQKLLKDNYVIADPKSRESLILEGIGELEKKHQFQVPVDPELLNEVRNLVEFPTVFVGNFEERFIKLPSEVLITSMKEHQRYFPVKDSDGNLLPHFVGVRNGDASHLETVAKGNEKVLRARLQDAEFFYEEDQKLSIDYYQEKLSRVVFQEKLGTIKDKVERISALTEKIAVSLGLNETDREMALRAAEISKFDLMTNMVNEFTELQGTIGEKYALSFGEQAQVAQAVREHYLPKQASGELPASVIGSVVSVSDKLDTIFGCISAGLIPSGSQDPYGLRRQASGVLRIMEEYEWKVSLEHLLEMTANVYKNLDMLQENQSGTAKELKEFFNLRAAYLMKEQQVEQDIIHAVLAKEIGRFDFTISKAKHLSAKRNDPEFKTSQEALVRVLNLSDKATDTEINVGLFQTDSEKKLFQKYSMAKNDFHAYSHKKLAKEALDCLEQLAQPIHDFFDNNMVMADDESIKKNRLALVFKISSLIRDYADLRLVEWKQQF